jgi:hypothetical protein
MRANITVPPCHGSCTGCQWEVRTMAGAAGTCQNEEQLAVECAEGVAAAVALLQPHFRRPEAHGHAADYLRGLIARSSARTAGTGRTGGHTIPRHPTGARPGMPGTPPPSARPCAGTSWRSWAIRRASWSSMKRAFRNRGGIRSAWPANLAGRSGRSPIARSGSFWAMRPPTAMSASTARCSCPRSGLPTGTAVGKRAFPTP